MGKCDAILLLPRLSILYSVDSKVARYARLFATGYRSLSYASNMLELLDAVGLPIYASKT